MNTTHSPARRRLRWLRFSQCVLAPAAAVTATALGISAFSSAAQAADPGPGYHGSAGYVGAARYEGRNAYCIDFDIPNPIGAATRPLGDGESLPERISKLDDLTRAQLHWVIDEFGTTDDASTAAAVTIFVWSLIEPTRYGGDERPIASVPPEERDRVRQLLAGLRAEVAKVTVGAELQVPAAELSLVASDDGALVRLTVSDVPRGTLITAEIDGAVVVPDGAASPVVASASETAQTAATSAAITLDQATTVMLQPAGEAVQVALTASHQTSAWTPSLRILLTEGRQTLIQSVPDSPATAQLKITVPPKPTPPPSTPPVTTPPVETPPVETPPVETPPVETPPVVGTTTPPATPPAVATTTPPVTPPASTPPAPSPEAPRTSTPPAQLATTGATGPALMTGIGMGMAALGCGGWLVSRRRYRPEGADGLE